MVACDKNDNWGNDWGTDPADETAVIGEYAGTMNVLEAAPTADSEEETPSGTEITAKVTADAIQFTDFPVRDLIIKVIGS